MKTPHSKGLKRLNESLKAQARGKYLRCLSIACSQYARLTGDKRLLGYLRSRQYHLLYEAADALSGQLYTDAATHFAAHQVAALVKKYPWDLAEVRLDPEATALRAFFASEHRCKWMNRWAVASYRRNADNTDILLRRMKGFIRRVLGTRPDLASIYAKCDYTGGASLGVHGNATNLGRKLLAEEWSVSPSALPYFAAALCHHFHYATKVARGNGLIQSLYVSEADVRESCKFADYNKVAFVPKTAKTHRSIAVEPLGNGYLQKGIDLEMRNRLKRIGIDLSDQSWNQRFAREGSIDDSEEGFATLDLSAASDSISIGLVKLLLPSAWFSLLDRVRSPSYKLPSGEVRRYEKFCSMGNGFCFPLETLIFAAACHAVTGGEPRRDFLVYGDDIIVRRKFAGGTISLLKRIGFKTNVRKTFVSGPFRESCGSNWFKGEDVTPFTLDYKLDCLPAYFKTINQARRNARTSVFLSRVVDLLLGSLPSQYLFLRPFKGPPDTAIDFLDLQLPKTWRWNKRYQCPSWMELKTSPVKDSALGSPPGWVLMAAALRGHASDAPFTLRRQVSTRVRVIARSSDTTPEEPRPENS